MQLGFVSAILADQSLDQVLAFAKTTGYSCVEIMCWPPGKADRRYAGVTHLDVTNLGPTDIASIHTLFAKHEISISGLGYYPNPLDPDPTIRETVVRHLLKVITAAQQLGVKVVNTFIGRNPRQMIEEQWDFMKTVWRPIVDHAEKCSVQLAIEHCPMIFSGKRMAWRQESGEFAFRLAQTLC